MGALMTDNEQSHLSGFDIEGVDLAKQILSHSDAASVESRSAIPQVFNANVLKSDFGMDGEKRIELLPEKGFDVINVGVGVNGEDSAVFARVLHLLRDGGHMTVPICKLPLENGKCKGDFRKYRRQGEQAVLEEGGYEVTWVVPELL